MCPCFVLFQTPHSRFFKHVPPPPAPINRSRIFVYNLRSVIQQLDGVTIARTMKLTTGCKEHAEDELLEAPSTDTPHAIETEFHGGEGVDPDEPENDAERFTRTFTVLHSSCQ